MRSVTVPTEFLPRLRNQLRAALAAAVADYDTALDHAGDAERPGGVGLAVAAARIAAARGAVRQAERLFDALGQANDAPRSLTAPAALLARMAGDLIDGAADMLSSREPDRARLDWHREEAAAGLWLRGELGVSR